MKAGLGSKSSFVWRSILWSRDIIRSGLCWRVGDEKSISIISDHWIYGIPGFRSSRNVVSNHSIKFDSLKTSDGR